MMLEVIKSWPDLCTSRARSTKALVIAALSMLWGYVVNGLLVPLKIINGRKPQALSGTVRFVTDMCLFMSMIMFALKESAVDSRVGELDDT